MNEKDCHIQGDKISRLQFLKLLRAMVHNCFIRERYVLPLLPVTHASIVLKLSVDWVFPSD
jgi:hypothetical protein